MATMTLHCVQCDTDWTRPAQRGRPPKLCPDCKAGKPVKVEVPKPVKDPKPKVAKRQPRWYDTPPAPAGLLEAKPLSERASGWCTDYDPAPLAQHAKCDGDLGKSRCNCPDNCHGWN
jgi:hypothetical protein